MVLVQQRAAARGEQEACRRASTGCGSGARLGQPLLDRATKFLAADPAVAAAWLAGSLGRDEADDLSDLDLWAAVEDGHMPRVVAARHDLVARLGQPLLVQEATWNVPSGGAYLLVLYPGEAGPQQSDWYWQPRSEARIPARAPILFERVGLSRSSPAAPSPEMALARAAELATIVPTMTFIAAKKIARSETWNAIGMLRAIWLEVDELRAILEGNWDGPPHSDHRRGRLPGTPREQIDWLRAVMAGATPLLVEVSGRDDRATTALAEIERFLDLVERLLDDPDAAPRGHPA
ncbi:MAG TPA: hypothetical protein VFN57_08425 [Thermomicrobiaceae bacterium]|nr:hypothetical protein [Thermomicrobiaceae bacterium]